ncbi:MAG: hypothetical protein AB2A00_34595 [Myxococcota bacterium]
MSTTTASMGLLAAADAACDAAAAREIDAARGHPGRLLAAARRLREAQAALAAGAEHARESLERATLLEAQSLEKEDQCRQEADDARLRGERALAKSLRRTARRAVDTRERAQKLKQQAMERRDGCAALADYLGDRAEKLELEGQEALAARCTQLAGLSVRVDIGSIRKAGGAAAGPACRERARTTGNTLSTLGAIRVDSIAAESRALALALLRQLLGPDQTLPATGLPELILDEEADAEAA